MSLARLLRSSTLPCLVRNSPFKTAKGKSYDVVDPHQPQQILHQASCITVDDVPTILAAAAQAQASWAAAPIADRQAVFNRAAQLLTENHELLARLEAEETTSTNMWAKIDWDLAKANLVETAAVATVGLKGSSFMSGPQRAYTERVPYGVVFAAAPWNSPANLGMRSIGAALMGGNAVVFKTSEYSPRVHLAVGQLLLEAGLPEGVLSVVHMDKSDAPEVTEAFIASREVQKINFTGSTVVGSKIAAVAGKHLVPSVMELGGKAPIVVLPSADLKLAVNNIIYSFTWHAGQICMSGNTVIVHQSIADEFMALLKEGTDKLDASPEDPMRRGLFSNASADRARGILKDALDKGAKVISGKPQSDQGNVIKPTVLENVSKDMQAYSHEFFAPFLSVARFNTDEEAIEIATRTIMDWPLQSGAKKVMLSK